MPKRHGSRRIRPPSQLLSAMMPSNVGGAVSIRPDWVVRPVLLNIPPDPWNSSWTSCPTKDRTGVLGSRAVDSRAFAAFLASPLPQSDGEIWRGYGPPARSVNGPIARWEAKSSIQTFLAGSLGTPHTRHANQTLVHNRFRIRTGSANEGTCLCLLGSVASHSPLCERVC